MYYVMHLAEKVSHRPCGVLVHAPLSLLGVRVSSNNHCLAKEGVHSAMNIIRASGILQYTDILIKAISLSSTLAAERIRASSPL